MKDLGTEQLPTNVDKNPWDEPDDDGYSPAERVAVTSPKRQLENEMQEQVDRDYDLAEGNS